MSIQNEELKIRAYTTKELATIYNVSDKTFNRWLSKIRTDVGEKNGRFYTINQVKVILDRLGLPGMVV